jgi:dolichol kinase
MEQLSLLIEALDYLDLVLAVFGAVVVSLWFGRGKNAWGLLSGALVGGLIKPAFYFIVLGGAFLASQDMQDVGQTPEQQDKILKFWTK